MNGLLAKRAELMNVNSELRERVAIVSNDIEAVERVLTSLGYLGQLVGDSPRAARIVLFYRNELRDYLLSEMRKSERPLTSRELAQRICEVEGKDFQDRRLLTDVVRRVGCTMRKMRAARVVEGERTDAGQVWRIAGKSKSLLAAASVQIGEKINGS